MDQIQRQKFHRPLVKELISGLFDVINSKKPASKVIEKILKKNNKWGSRDRRIFAEVFYEIIRWRYALSYEATGQIDEPADLLAHYYLKKNNFDFLDPMDMKGMGGYNLSKAPLWVQYSFSEAFHNYCLKEIKDIKAYYKLSQQIAPVFIRANTEKIKTLDLQKELKQEEIKTKVIDILPSGLKLSERQNVFKTKVFKEGKFEVQDGGSQLIAPFLDIQEGQRVIDACAGSGGKTLHIANLLKNKGKVIALDIYEWKLQELKKRARRNSLQNIETKLIDGQKTIKRLNESADRLLLDVPCTGSGVFRRNPDSKYRWEAPDLERILNLQQEILTNYSKMLKVGGKMVYSTCSVFRSENEAQVESFLKANPGWELEAQRNIAVGENDFDGFYMARLLKKS